MGMPKNLFLIRHGQSEGNATRKNYEQTGDESFFSEEFLKIHESQYALTEMGTGQAKMAGKWLKDNGFSIFDRTLVSNNVRAMQTAAYLDLPDAEWLMDFNLRERDGGLFNTVSPSRRDKYYKDQQNFFNSQPFFFHPPQGESIAAVCQRVKIILDTLARECDGKNVAIVCHGHVMRSFRIVLERMSLAQINDYLLSTEEFARVPNCAIMQYTRENPGNPQHGLANYLNWTRMIRPAGGGELEDQFSLVSRKKYSNAELLIEADKNRNI
ncbi:MAG: histidine phosphatase family protein [Candidatus Falkowbacteria bacterium]|nr:histidine phosphatase family protein [Candidatus Falkowbacteria bacterium]